MIIKNKIIFILLFFLLVIHLYSLDGRMRTGKAIVAVNNLNIRDYPSSQSKVIGKVMAGDIVEVIKGMEGIGKEKIDYMNDYWYEIKINDCIGYCYGYYLLEFTGKFIYSHYDLGICIFLDDNYKLSKIMTYDSYQKIMRVNKYSHEKDVRFIAQGIGVEFDKIAILSNWKAGTIPNDYEGGSINYEIYNNLGKMISKGNEFPPNIEFNKKDNLLLLIYSKCEAPEPPKYSNLLQIITINGKIIKELKTNVKCNELNYWYTWKQGINYFCTLYYEEYDKFFLSTNKMLMVLDLKNYNIKYISYSFNYKESIVVCEIKKYYDLLDILFNFEEDEFNYNEDNRFTITYYIKNNELILENLK